MSRPLSPVPQTMYFSQTKRDIAIGNLQLDGGSTLMLQPGGDSARGCPGPPWEARPSGRVLGLLRRSSKPRATDRDRISGAEGARLMKKCEHFCC